MLAATNGSLQPVGAVEIEAIGMKGAKARGALTRENVTRELMSNR